MKKKQVQPQPKPNPNPQSVARAQQPTTFWLVGAFDAEQKLVSNVEGFTTIESADAYENELEGFFAASIDERVFLFKVEATMSFE